MNESQGVPENSPAPELGSPVRVEDQMVEALSAMRAETEEASSASDAPDVQGETEPDSDESAEVKADAKIAEAETEAEGEEGETISKKSFLKRVNGLNATKRRLEKEVLLHQKDLAEYKAAFEILSKRAQDAERKLHEYESVDPNEQKLMEYERERQANEIRQRLEAEHQSRIANMERQAQVEQRADAIIQEANHLSSKYPTITAEELVYKFRSSDKDLSTLAKEMHDARYEHLKTMFATEKPPAPRKVKPQGSVATVSGTSEEDMLAYLQQRRS